MTFRYQPPVEPLEIVYEDKDVIGVIKPSGLLSVPGRETDKQDSLYTRLCIRYPLAQMVHRLDMDTSGIMIVALRRKAERALKAQFQTRTIQKTYQAVVSGIPRPTEGTMDFPLLPHPSKSLRHVVDPAGKRSITDYTVAETYSDSALLSLNPRTGRSHQIRVHLQYLGHPILGDRFYAPEVLVQAASRLMLHATEITFQQPYSGQRITLTAPWSPENNLQN